MSLIPVFNFFRVTPRNETFLNGRRGQKGEIFYDRESETLRLFNGSNQGGINLAKSDLSNISNNDFLEKANDAGLLTNLSAIAASGDYNDLVVLPTSFDNLTSIQMSQGVEIYEFSSDDTLSDNSDTALPTEKAVKTYIDTALSTITADTGNVTFTGSTIHTDDSSSITITPPVIFSSDINVGNEVIANTISTIDINISGSITSTGSGTPEIVSDNEINLDAGTRVDLIRGPMRMARFTTGERDSLVAQNGDIIYNTTSNKFQGYENGSWTNLI